MIHYENYFKRIVLKSPNEFQIDLIYMPKSWFNSGYKYIFACVDVFSKKADMIPMKERDSTTSAKAFEKILDNMVYQRQYIRTRVQN